ncbi:MAG: cation transporter [Candidatus Thorarchaeota archaeon]
MHTFSAVGGVLLAMFAGKLVERRAGPEKTFGYLRAEIIGSLLNGFFLLGMAFFVLWMGYNRLVDPIELPPLPMLISAGGGIITEVVSIYYLYKGEEMNLNVRGAFWHILQTFVRSLISNDSLDWRFAHLLWSFLF